MSCCLSGVGREKGEGIPKLSNVGWLFMNPRDLNNNLTPTPLAVVNTPTRSHFDGWYPSSFSYSTATPIPCVSRLHRRKLSSWLHLFWWGISFR